MTADYEAIKLMRNSIEQITDAYAAVREIMPNTVMESLMDYNIKLEKKEKDLKNNE